MNINTKFKLISSFFLFFIIFSFGLDAKAEYCIWKNKCEGTEKTTLVANKCPTEGKTKDTPWCCCALIAPPSEAKKPATGKNPICSFLGVNEKKEECNGISGTIVKDDSFCSENTKKNSNDKCCCTQTPAAAAAAAATKPAPTLNNPFDNLSIKIPGLYEMVNCKKNADGTYTCPKVNCETMEDGSTSCAIPWLSQYIIAIYNYALVIIGTLAAVTTMAGGVIWLVSGSNASKMKVAKDMIVGSISGLVLLFSSYMLLSIINPGLLDLQPITLQNIPEAMIDSSDISDSPLGTGYNPYQEGCDLARKGDYSKCKSYGSQRPANLVQTIGGYYVTPIVKEKLEKALQCVKDKNNGKNTYNFTIIESWRSPSQQVYQKEKWTKKGKPGNAATPCCSNHGSGNAVDLKLNGGSMSWDANKKSGLTACMNANGLYANLSSEAWHWSLTGK